MRDRGRSERRKRRRGVGRSKRVGERRDKGDIREKERGEK